MVIDVPAGSYVIAVSGGVDSVVLLDLLRLYPNVQLTVAHYDHGIRDDSTEDRRHVQQLAQRYQLPFVYDEGHLGAGASEATAREARYDFLNEVKRVRQADALVTAHHQDDLLETIIINLMRGTGRKGLSSLTNGEGIIRPLLEVPKTELIDYAQRHGLVWREDSTNDDPRYLRNKVRRDILSTWSPSQKARLAAIGKHMREVNQQADALLGPMVEGNLDRHWFNALPHTVAREVIAAWLRVNGIIVFDAPMIERLTIAAKTARPGTLLDVSKGSAVHVGKDILALN